jgi:hypothetical protein
MSGILKPPAFHVGSAAVSLSKLRMAAVFVVIVVVAGVLG